MIFKKYSVELVKEESKRYDVDRTIKGPEDIYRIAKEVLRLDRKAEEEFHILCLDTKNNVIGSFLISKGTINQSLVAPREVFKRAMLLNANSIVLLHNHPSGDSMVSVEDRKITDRLVEGGKILGINILDHVVIGDNEYCSFKEKCLI